MNILTYTNINTECDIVECDIVDDYRICYSIITFQLNNQLVELSAQYDCGENWCYYNGGGDGESIEQTADCYFKKLLQNDKDNLGYNNILKVLELALKESEPDVQSHHIQD